MRFEQIVVGLLCAAVTAPALARQGSADADAVIIGRVERIYVCMSHRFFIEKKLVRRTEGREVWVEIRFERPDYPASELALLQVSADVERGDLVETRLADRMPVIRGTLPEVSRVSKLVARHDTLQAMLFGLSNRRSPLGQFVQADMCPTNVAYGNTNLR